MGDNDRKAQTPQKADDKAPVREGTAAGATATRGAAASARGAKSAQPKPEKQVKIESAPSSSALASSKPKPESSTAQMLRPDDDDEDEYGKPKDIDRINISSDEGEDEAPPNDQDAERNRGMMPIRMERKEHVDRQIGINTESSAATAAGARKSVSTVELSDGDEADTTEAKARKVQRENKGKARAEADAEAMDLDSEVKARPRRKSSSRKTPIFQTEEQKREYDGRQRDLESMLQELDQMGLYKPEQLRQMVASEEEAEERMEEGMRKEARRDANVFLFQLPPVMPNLLPTGTKIKVEDKSKVEEPKVKEENVEEISPKQEEEIKVEEGQDPAAAAEAMLKGNGENDEQLLKVRPGYVGKLVVHRSGRTTLDWGGTRMNVTAGTNMQKLQTAVLARMTVPDDKKKAAEGRWEGNACSMGQVRGKFVVTPDWTEMLR